MRLLSSTRSSLYHLSHRLIQRPNTLQPTSTLRFYNDTRISCNMADATTKESEIIPIPAEQAIPASSEAVKPESATPAAGEHGAAPAEQSKKGGKLCNYL